MNLKNKVIVITGSSDGLGKELALWSASKGLKVALVSKSESKLEKVKEQIIEQGGIAQSFACDVGDSKNVAECVGKIMSKFSKIDILVNNAGIWIEGELSDNDVKDIHSVIETNTLGTIYTTKQIIPIMKKEKSGLIINVVSQAGLYAKPERSVYNTSKWAITGFTKSLQVEVAKYGIRVTGFYPGLMNTQLFEKVGIKKDKTNALDLKKALSVFEFLFSCDEDVLVPEIGVKNINN